MFKRQCFTHGKISERQHDAFLASVLCALLLLTTAADIANSQLLPLLAALYAPSAPERDADEEMPFKLVDPSLLDEDPTPDMEPEAEARVSQAAKQAVDTPDLDVGRTYIDRGIEELLSQEQGNPGLSVDPLPSMPSPAPDSAPGEPDQPPPPEPEPAPEPEPLPELPDIQELPDTPPEPEPLPPQPEEFMPLPPTEEPPPVELAMVLRPDGQFAPLPPQRPEPKPTPPAQEPQPRQEPAQPRRTPQIRQIGNQGQTPQAAAPSGGAPQRIQTRTRATMLADDPIMNLLRSRYGEYMDKLARQLQASLNRAAVLTPMSLEKGQVKIRFGISPDGSLTYQTTLWPQGDQLVTTRRLSEQMLDEAAPFDPLTGAMLTDENFQRLTVIVTIY